LDIRVGKITKAYPNPNSEKLYNEEIDMGNGELRTIASGLQKHITLENMQGAMVVVLCNLKPRTLAEYVSQGMVLCAQPADASKIEFLSPPAGSQPGDIVTFEGYERKPLDVLPSKKSPWDDVKAGFITNGDKVGCYRNPEGKELSFTTTHGVCSAATVANGIV
jgi:methionyl-tRNA synthetase